MNNNNHIPILPRRSWLQRRYKDDDDDDGDDDAVTVRV